MATEAEWERIRDGLRFGQVVTGSVVRVPRPGAIGVFVDIGLGVGGFVDVALLPRRSEDWPAEGTVTDFEVWWVHGDHQQVRLKPSDPQYLCEDFADFVARFRPHWPSDIGAPVRGSRPPTL
ncbi:S1 RNA-binding domain-containing protein [Streptomyces decoyicus]|uniref:S1 RNA-binding domain-containing protein n=1 Tax=Streptomyces decoyicus TaxID=249567 RepID=UPI002E357840|nr:S1 RNA-binding domain-containing protein [Streptomyces decoyicus]